MVDLTGLQLNSNYYLFTLQNTLPYLFSPIWKDQDFISNWSDPIQFLANGTLPYNMYWDDSLTYRLEVRNGPTQSDALIYLIENYIPNSSGDIPTPSSEAATTDNQLSNPQFATVYQTPITSTATTINFAPGWQIVGAGGSDGSVTITQIQIEGSADVETNPSYAIQITSSGWSTITLQQIFNGNGALWAGQSVTMSLTGLSSPEGLTVTGNIQYSNGVTSKSVVTAVLSAGYNEFIGASELDTSTNTDPPSSAQTIYQLTWAAGSTVTLTSLQLIGEALPVEIPYQQVTLERQLDQEFHYYSPQLSYKPIPSYLVGWEFAFNPCQALGTTVTAVTTGSANSSYYIADQTILFQSVDASFGMAQNGSGMVFTAGNTSSFALVQYLSSVTAIELLSQRMSLQLQGLSNQSGLTGTVSLAWINGSLPSVPISSNYVSVVASIASGIPTLQSGWAFVPRGQLSVNAPFTLSTSSQTLSFNQFDATAVSGISSATYFAVIIAFNSVTAAKTVTLNYCSLNGGEIPSRPAAQSPDQVLGQCQYYYEKSYPATVVPGTSSTTANQQLAWMTIDYWTSGVSTTATCRPSAFQVNYKSIKRTTAPNITLYGPASGTSADVNAAISENGTAVRANADVVAGTYWANPVLGDKSAYYAIKSASSIITYTDGGGLVGPTGYITYQYVADARLGQVN